jgi:phage protein D
VSIEVEGVVRPELNSSLKTLLVEDAVDALPRCEVCLTNWGPSGDEVTYLYFDRTVLDFGKALAVRIGSKEEIFHGFISAIEGRFGGDEPPSIIVHAEGALAALRTPRRTRTFENMNDASVFRQIAAENGLQAVVDVQEITHEVLAQFNQSDLAFIRERASWLDAEVWLQDRQLYVMSRTTRTANANEVHVAPGRGLQEFRVTADIANQYTNVIVSGWDVAHKDRISYNASDSVLGHELDNGLSSAEIIQNVSGERTNYISQQQPLSTDQAQCIARAAFSQQARRFVTGHGTARGDSRIRVGTRLVLSGIGEIFSGTYIVTRVQHRYQLNGDSGFTTSFIVERPSIGTAGENSG